MKTKLALWMALLLSASMLFPCLAEELLENPDFSQRQPKGFPVAWLPLDGTKGDAENGILTLANKHRHTVLIQIFRPRPEKRLGFSVEVMLDEPGKVRAYMECEFMKDGKQSGFSSGAVWKDAQPGKWMTISGEMKALPKDYAKCYFAIMTDTGRTLHIRKPHCEPLPDEWLPNADFSRMNGGMPTFWSYRGKSPASVSFNGNAVKLADGILIQTHLPLATGRKYRISLAMRGQNGATGRSYIEWNVRTPDGKEKYGANAGSGWIPMNGQWLNRSYELNYPENATFSYFVLGAKDGQTVEFKDLKVEESKPVGALGGLWQLKTHVMTPEGLLQKTQEPPPVLQNIPVRPGTKYALSYDVKVLEDKPLSEDGGFFQLRSFVTPAGVVGASTFADVLHGKVNIVQKRTHIFSIPADSNIKAVSFHINGMNPGKMLLGNFKLEAVAIKDSDSWELKVLQPFYRDSFYPGDDMSQIVCEAQSAGAHVLRVTFNGKTQDFQATGATTRVALPFNLPVGKYNLKCDFMKDGKTEKSFEKTIARLPEAPNVVKVTPDRKITFNGKPFFPIYNHLAEFSETALYFAARHGINTVLVHLADEDELLRQLDLAHKYGIKLTVYPCPPFKAAHLEWFRKKVKECLTPRVITHPALFCYGMPDEPLLAGVPVPVIQEDYQILKEHDPYHPCWLNAAPRNEVEDLKPYGAASDLLGVDIYPIPYPGGHSGIADKFPTCCGKYALRMNKIGCGKKAIIMYLQGFAWHECTSNPNAAKSPYPTAMESHFMAFDSLLNGSTGYYLWGVNFVQTVDYYKEVYKLYEDLHRYSGLFASGRQLPDIKTSNPAIRCAVMEHDGHKFYFFLNTSNQTQSATAPVKGNILDSDGGTFQNGTVVLSKFEVISVADAPLPPPCQPLPPRNKNFEQQTDPAFKAIADRERIRRAPFYKGNANWIWYEGGQVGLAQCFAEKKFQVTPGDHVELLVSGDDIYAAYLNGKEVVSDKGWANMRHLDLTALVKPGENQLVIRGTDGGAAPCGILAEIHAGNTVIPTDTSWKVRAAYKNDTLPADFAQDAHAVIVAPYGGGAWGKGVRIFKQ